MLADNFFKNIPNHRLLPLNHFARLLDRGGVALFFELVVDERLEQFQGHLLGQTALMQFKFRPNNYYRSPGVVDAFAEQVLTKTSLLAFECSGERLERTIVHAAQHASTTAIVEQSIHR